MVTPVSKKTFRLFPLMKFFCTLTLCRLFEPAGKPFAFINPILVLPPLSFGCIFTYLIYNSSYDLSEISLPIMSLKENNLLLTPTMSIISVFPLIYC